MIPARVVTLLVMVAIVAGAAGCGLKDYGTRTGPLPSPTSDAWRAMKDAPCALMASLGYEQRGGTVTPTGEVSCFGEWARVHQDTTETLRLDQAVAWEGQRGSAMGWVGGAVTRIAITGRTTVQENLRTRHIDASEQIRRDADTVMQALRDLYLKS
jgi:hypothetical protein